MERLDSSQTPEVIRDGAYVRRTAGEWTPAVHAVLRHLEQTGYSGAPRAIGSDNDGREVLTFVEGVVPRYPDVWPDCVDQEETLQEVVVLVRGFHDALIDFPFEAPHVWRRPVTQAAQTICHNDLGRYNTVYRDGHAVAFIDWDYCCPATRIWDVAHVAWRWALMHREGPGGPSLEQRASRVSVVLRTYDLFDADELLDAVQQRQEWNLADARLSRALEALTLGDIRFLVRQKDDLLRLIRVS